jgi:transporter family protein
MHFPKWLFPALLCILWWGLFGFLAKLGSDKTPPALMQILFTVGMIPLVIAAFLRAGRRLETDRIGAGYGILNGLFSGIGAIAYFAAMGSGQASIVGPLTSLYPLVTVVLSMLVLRERLNLVQTAGVILGLTAVAILSA